MKDPLSKSNLKGDEGPSREIIEDLLRNVIQELVSTNWILSTGFWMDTKFWEDGNVWID